MAHNRDLIAELTHEKIQFRKKYLKENLAAPDAVVNLNQGKEGGIMLSLDSNYETSLQPSFIEIKDIDTLKKLYGDDDRIYREGNVKTNYKIPDTLSPKGKLGRDELCDVMHAYLFGDSADCAAYKDMLQKVYFPMTVPVFDFGSGVIIVDQEHPLTIKPDPKHPDDPVAINAHQMIIRDGGYIKAECRTIWTLDICGENKKTDKAGANAAIQGGFNLVGEKGTDGDVVTGNGSDGNKGGKGTNSISGKKSCSTEAGKGGTGGKGGAGKSGNKGGNGGGAPPVEMEVESLSQGFKVWLIGGAGGKGSDGTNGGKGGDGGDGGDGSSECNAGAMGVGGDGGNGGNGSDGGNGGAGGNFTLRFTTSSIDLRIFEDPENVKLHGGAGGACGSAGVGGAGGSGVGSGSPGSSGSAGKAGDVGEPGRINIIQK